MMQAGGATVENNSLTDVVVGLIVASHVEASLSIVRVVGDAGGVLDVAYAAEQTHATAEVLGLTIEVQGVLSHVLGFQVLSPPLVQGWILKALDE